VLQTSMTSRFARWLGAPVNRVTVERMLASASLLSLQSQRPVIKSI